MTTGSIRYPERKICKYGEMSKYEFLSHLIWVLLGKQFCGEKKHLWSYILNTHRQMEDETDREQC